MVKKSVFSCCWLFTCLASSAIRRALCIAASTASIRTSCTSSPMHGWWSISLLPSLPLALQGWLWVLLKQLIFPNFWAWDCCCVWGCLLSVGSKLFWSHILISEKVLSAHPIYACLFIYKFMNLLHTCTSEVPVFLPAPQCIVSCTTLRRSLL